MVWMSEAVAYGPVVVAGEEQPAKEAMCDNDCILTTCPFLHVSIQCLQEH